MQRPTPTETKHTIHVATGACVATVGQPSSHRLLGTGRIAMGTTLSLSLQSRQGMATGELPPHHGTLRLRRGDVAQEQTNEH